jgi:hypothetical protein
MKHDITAMLCVAEYGEREWLFCQMGSGMNPRATGIASIMSFLDRIKLIPFETESKTCCSLNFLDLHGLCK